MQGSQRSLVLKLEKTIGEHEMSVGRAPLGCSTIWPGAIAVPQSDLRQKKKPQLLHILNLTQEDHPELSHSLT